MSRIRIERAHALAPRQARKAAEKMSDRLSEAFDMEFAWEGEVLQFSRAGVEGRLILGHKEVVIEAQLGLVLALMKPRIEASIHENLDQIFGEAKKPKPRKAAAKKK